MIHRLNEILDYLTPTPWTSSSGVSNLRPLIIKAEALDFLRRLVNLTEQECQIFRFDGERFHLGHRRYLWLDELEELTWDSPQDSPVFDPKVPHRVTHHGSRIKRVATLTTLKLHYDRTFHLNFYEDYSFKTSSYKIIEDKILILRDMSISCNIRNHFKDFQDAVNQEKYAAHDLALLRKRLAELEKVIQAYETLDIAEDVKDWQYGDAYKSAWDEEDAVNSNIRDLHQQEIEAKTQATVAIQSVKNALDRARKMTILSEHLSSS